MYYLLLELGRTHPQRFVEAGQCKECMNKDCCCPSWYRLPPGHFHCDRVLKADVPEIKQGEVEKWHKWDSDDANWDSDNECEVPLEPDEMYYTYVHSIAESDELYDSDRFKAILSRNRYYTQTNSNARGLSEGTRRQILRKKEHWAVVCPKLNVPTCKPVFPKGTHPFW